MSDRACGQYGSRRRTGSGNEQGGEGHIEQALVNSTPQQFIYPYAVLGAMVCTDEHLGYAGL